MNSRHQNNNLLQGSHSRGVLFGAEERQALARLTNIESLDGTIHCERTSNGWAIGANPVAEDTVATLSWDADALIATITFDYHLYLKGGSTRHNSAHDFTTLDDSPGIIENASNHTQSAEYKIDISAVPLGNYGVISFYIPNYYVDGNGYQVWGIPGLEEDLILISDYYYNSDITATRTYTTEGVETVDEAVTVRAKTSHGSTGYQALEEYRRGHDGFETSHWYLCSLVVDRIGTDVKAWLFGHYGKSRTLVPENYGIMWHPGNLELKVTDHLAASFAGYLINRVGLVNSDHTPKLLDDEYSFTFDPSQSDTAVGVGISYDPVDKNLTLGENPGGGGYWNSMVSFQLQNSEIAYISQINTSWHPGVLTVTPSGGALRGQVEMSWPIRYINGSSNQQTDTLEFDSYTGRLHFVSEDEDTTTADETIDVFVTSGPDEGKRLRLTMIGNNLYEVSSRTNRTSNRQFELTDITGDTHNFILWNTGAFYCNSPHSSFPFI